MPAEPDDVFKALADPTRRALLERLLRAGSELNVRALTEQAGVSQPMVSKHLNVLKAAGLVQERPEGRVVPSRPEPRGRAPLPDWMRFSAVFGDERLDRLKNFLNRRDQ